MRVVTLFTFCLLIQAVYSVLPPLDETQRLALSSHVLEGTVVQLYSTEAARAEMEGFIDLLTVLELEIDQVKLGSYSDKIAYASYYKAFKRPTMWVGPTGQYVYPEVGDKVRLYVQKTAEGRYQVLEPNGIEILSEGKDELHISA